MQSVMQNKEGVQMTITIFFRNLEKESWHIMASS